MSVVDADLRAQILESDSIDAVTQHAWLSELQRIVAPHIAAPEAALFLCVFLPPPSFCRTSPFASSGG